jgi:hypothetical protein
MRVEDLLEMRGQRKIASFVESDNEDTWVHRSHRWRDERFGSGC